MTPTQIKKQFPILKTKVYSKPLVYLDNAATSQKPEVVIDTITKYYKKDNANIHRGVYFLSEQSTLLYEGAREKVAKFINAQNSKEIIFTSGATHSLNLAAYSYISTFLKKGDEILITEGEHHSNVIPWQKFGVLRDCKVKHVKLDKEGRLNFKYLKKKLENENTKILAITHASNTSGVINDIKVVCKLAHSNGVKVCVDACQSAPHIKLDVKDLDCDMLAFSGHKMLGPTGIGVLYAKYELLDNMEPFMGGGGMISEVDIKGATWAEVPQKFEAGTPNIVGAIGLGTAIDYLETVGLDNIHKHEINLTKMVLDAFNKDDKIKVYGPTDLENRLGIISFGIEGVHPHDVATVLDQEGIAIRAGHHCAQILMKSWGATATARVSFYLYNTKKDVEMFLKAVKKVKHIFGC